MYLIEVPVEDGGLLLVQISDAELPGDLQLASAQPGEVVARARQSLEQALDQIKPAMRAVLDRLTRCTTMPFAARSLTTRTCATPATSTGGSGSPDW